MINCESFTQICHQMSNDDDDTIGLGNNSNVNLNDDTMFVQM